MNINLSQHTIPRSNPIRFTISGLQLDGCGLHYALFRVDDEDTTFAQSGPATIVTDGDDHTIQIDASKDLEAGLYQLGQLEVVDGSGVVVNKFDPGTFGVVLFELTDFPSTEHTGDDLRERLNAILVLRDTAFYSGIGDGSNMFEVLVFVRDLLITRPMRLAQCEAIPMDGVGFNDEIAAMNHFLSHHGIGTLQNTERVLADAKRSQPGLVVHYPLVRAPDHEAAATTAEVDADRVALALALSRGAPATTFGVFTLDRGTGQAWYRLRMPRYHGNLLGGEMSGEQPKPIRQRLLVMRRTPRIQLYVSLYREAQRELDSEVQYFRYWSLLETVARGRNYVGRPLMDDFGQQRFNRHGEPRSIRNDAEELVFELVRDVVLQGGYPQPTTEAPRLQNTLFEDLPTWYQRRNCFVHGGDCLCRGTHHGHAPAKQLNCKRARDGAAGPTPFDSALLTLRTTCELLLPQLFQEASAASLQTAVNAP